jgi:ABC-type polysaccharide/polyol phosphate export permease
MKYKSLKSRIERTFFKVESRYNDAKSLTGFFLSPYTEVIATVILFNQKGWNTLLIIPLIMIYIVFHLILGTWIHKSGFKERKISFLNSFNKELMGLVNKK